LGRHFFLFKIIFTQGKTIFTQGKIIFTQGKIIFTRGKIIFTQGKIIFTELCNDLKRNFTFVNLPVVRFTWSNFGTAFTI
jgi:hypothetical protein